MSGSIGRSYLIQQWSEASSYSGNMIGERLKQSTDLYLANGKANTGLFAEEQPKKKAKKTAFQTITLADNHYERLHNLGEALDKQLDNGEISIEDHTYARRQLDSRLEKAWKRVEKARGWTEDTSPMLPYRVQGENDSRGHLERKKSTNNTVFSENPLTTTHVSCNNVFNEISDDNVFKKAYLFYMKMRGV
jgi:hypothetical protein